MKLTALLLLPLSQAIPASSTVRATHSADQVTLQQPSCDDNSPAAADLFAIHARAIECLAALQNHSSAPDYRSVARLQRSSAYQQAIATHETFLNAMRDFEPMQNRLCRWQRLTQFPPDIREAHVVAFTPVQEAWSEVIESRSGLGSVGWDVGVVEALRLQGSLEACWETGAEVEGVPGERWHA
ncbi:hypothetical protein LTR53_002366 [Teratosphaeriaceae sp. CCFEE 6253]|nr:hypothetical protein LTR53_002366 [Teratosphaeriaceae sp. CCFEE 6253]